MPNQDIWSFYLDDQDEWRWQRTASNNEIVGASTEGYQNRSDCVANAVRQGYSLDAWEFYEGGDGDHRWRRRARNNEIVGASHEGYVKPNDCLANAMRHGYDGTL